MEVKLLPHVGVATFRLGMSVEEARRAAQELSLRATGANVEAEPGQMLFAHDESSMDFVLGFTKGALVGVDVWRFRNEDADVQVTLEGRDVFRTPSEELLQRFEEQGHTVEENDLGFDALTDLKVIFSNHSSFEYPVDEDGDPLYFDYVRVSTEPIWRP